MSEPREIKPEEVRVGDTIKYSKTARVIRKGLVYCDLDNFMTITTEDFDIELLNRPLPKHEVGKRVRYHEWYAKQMGENSESELTPVEEEAWEPKFGDWVTYTGTQVNSFVPGTKALITGFDLYEEPHEVFLELEGGDSVWVPITSITKWKEAQP